MNRSVLFSLALLPAAMGMLCEPASAQNIPDYITRAVNDPSRPAADKERDADRKPAESVAFSTMKPGDAVGEMIPGRGYFTRIFSKIVGPAGHVYVAYPKQMLDRRPEGADAVKAIAADPAYPNITVMVQSTAAFSAPVPLDVVWTSQNYHDLKNPGFGSVDTVALNKTVFAALKPGGVYYVLDHAAAKGAGFTQTQTLHRSDKDAVKAEVLAAGFVFDGESNVLANPKDDHTKHVDDASIVNHTDQYIMRFRKPR